MHVQRRFLAILALLWITSILTAHADTFTYSYYYDPVDGFTVTSPTLITSPVDFTGPTDCIAPVPSPSVCRFVHIDPVLGRVSWQGVHAVTQTYFDSFFAPPADFLVPGVYDIGGNPFSIVDNATGVTPEPSSLILIATGIFAMAGVMRRRTQQHRVFVL